MYILIVGFGTRDWTEMFSLSSLVGKETFIPPLMSVSESNRDSMPVNVACKLEVLDYYLVTY